MGTRNEPRWLRFGSLGPALLGEHLEKGDGATHVSYNGTPVDAKPPLLGLLSLSPCEDGTLLAAIMHRTIVATPIPYEYMQYDITDTWTIQTAAYDIDPARGTIGVGSWTQIPGQALQVQKLAMPGWNLLSSLIAKRK